MSCALARTEEPRKQYQDAYKKAFTHYTENDVDLTDLQPMEYISIAHQLVSDAVASAQREVKNVKFNKKFGTLSHTMISLEHKTKAKIHSAVDGMYQEIAHDLHNIRTTSRAEQLNKEYHIPNPKVHNFTEYSDSNILGLLAKGP